MLLVDSSLWFLLAQQPAAPRNDDGFGGIPWWLPMAMIAVVFYFLILRPQSKERRQMSQMLANLKKNDRVVTIGGIYGTVVEVQPEKVVLRVDENSNTRLRVSRTSISRVVSDEKGEEKSDAG